jgi:hypothetical protein
MKESSMQRGLGHMEETRLIRNVWGSKISAGIDASLRQRK